MYKTNLYLGTIAIVEKWNVIKRCTIENGKNVCLVYNYGQISLYFYEHIIILSGLGLTRERGSVKKKKKIYTK